MRRTLARPPRGRDELRDARMRAADARLRLQDARGRQDRGARRGAGRDDQDAGRRGAYPGRPDARHRGCREAQRRRGRDGRRGERDRPRDDARPHRKRALPARIDEAHRDEARPRDRVELPLHPGGGQGSRRLGEPPRVPSAAEIRRGRRREGRRGRRRARPAAECGRGARLRTGAAADRNPRRERAHGGTAREPGPHAPRGGALRGEGVGRLRHSELAVGPFRGGGPRGGGRAALRPRQHPRHDAVRSQRLAAFRRALPREGEGARDVPRARLHRGDALFVPLGGRTRCVRRSRGGARGAARVAGPRERRVRRAARFAAAAVDGFART